MKITIESPLQEGESFSQLAENLQLQHSLVASSPGFIELNPMERFKVSNEMNRVLTILHRLDLATSCS